ncbi:MAG: isochorismatase family protein [Actinomycetota bacterium]|nr:isochorismatase family protein [Actinomycetota bacterium]
MTVELLDPARTALLVIDMQNAFCHSQGTLGVSGVDVEPAQRIIPPVRKLVEGCGAAGIPILWTLQEHFATDHSRGKKRLASHTSKRKQVSALAGSWDAEIVDELAPLASDPTLVVRKHRFGAFYQTRLEKVLNMMGVEALLVTGATTNACVETSIREAYLRDYDVVAVTDCIAGVREEWVPTAHEVWAQYFCELATSEEVEGWLDSSAAPRALALGHILLQVTDLDAAEHFYLGLLGLTVKKREKFRDGRPLLVTNEGLGLTDGGPNGRGPVEHIAFRARDVPAMADRARASGVTIIRGPERSSYGRSLYLADPDGNQVELFGAPESAP